VENCESGSIELDERMLRIALALVSGPLRFNQLKRITGMHQEVLSRKIRVLIKHCIIAHSGGLYYLCKDALKAVMASLSGRQSI